VSSSYLNCFQATSLAVGVSGGGEEGGELLEGAENGRYKVIAKAEPYKNLPVSVKLSLQNFSKIRYKQKTV